MKRWNGWGLETVPYALSRTSRHFLTETLGQSRTGSIVPLEDLLARVPASRFSDHPLLQNSAEHRLRHARGQSLPDWVALRYGTCDTFPDAVAYPSSEEELDECLSLVRRINGSVIPYGGGTSVVGGITPLREDRPVLTVDLSRMCELLALDEMSGLATFGAGVSGPHLEAPLRSRGFTLGHFPQSFEFSTLGGWIATRSAGQQSLRYGRIEDLFAGGRLISPAGKMDLPPFAASAAGPDLRQWVLGSEGRMGIISQATVRVSRLPDKDVFIAIFFPSWPQGVAAVRDMAQSRLGLSMLRLCNSLETATTLILSGHDRLSGLLERYLNARGLGSERCLLMMGVTGSASQAARSRRTALSLARRHGGIFMGSSMGETWRKKRFQTPYLRNTLWELGYAVDTMETCLPWSSLLDAPGPILNSLRHALEREDERVLAFGHISHVYPTGASLYITTLFRLTENAEETLARWQTLKDAVSREIHDRGGTITHQHGVGLDHRGYLEEEKGALGLEGLGALCRTFDPTGMMNPGKLLPNGE